MIPNSEIEKYKDYPEGSGGKMMYDRHNLPTEEFFTKYYLSIDLSDWNLWMSDTVNKAWEEKSRIEFQNSWGERMNAFNFSEMERFYKEEDLSMFDEDIQKFISFMAGDRFFEENNLTLNEWIKLDTFTNPKKDYKQDVTLLRALEYDGGMNYIRMQLVNLHWWKH